MVGLGNPGERYAHTRHNIGARVVERLADSLGLRIKKARFLPVDAAEATIGGARVFLARPRSFMNESGPPIAGLARRRRVTTERIVACHDDIDLPLGALKLKLGGSTAGHHGLNSLVNALHSADFHRVRLGVGRPPARKDPADYVLERFAEREREEAEFLAQDGADAVLALIRDGLGAAQEGFNRAGPR